MVRTSYRARLLEGLTKPELDAIIGAASRKRFKARCVVQRQGDSADRLWLITEGSARHFYVTESGQKVILLTLRAGDIFGARAMLRKPCSYLLGTETVVESVFLMWDRNTIRELSNRFPRVSENVLSVASDYLAWYLSTHLALITQEARERLAEVILSLSEGVGSRTENGLELEITNEELANTANVTLFTVSRILSEWRRDGVLSKTKGKILLPSPSLLRHLIRKKLRPVTVGAI